MESEQTSRLGIALAISFAAHIFVGVCAEVASAGPSKKSAPPPPVEISRVAMDGSSLPTGKGEGSFNSPASVASPGFGQKYNLDAGVPTKIPIPSKSQPQTQPQPTAATSNVGQLPNHAPPQQSNPATNGSQTPPRQNDPTNQEFMPPLNQNNGTGNAPPSMASRPSSAGNQGKPRSRGPNRIAFPEFTVEPQVPLSLMTAGVTNSVDVAADIAADGTHTERIVRSSGSAQVDQLVLDALKQWRWDPAAKEGQPVASTQNFKFNFKPR